jgi:hypothetical protein
MSDQHNQSTATVHYDPKLTNKELSETISALGMKKANTHPWQLFLLGILESDGRRCIQCRSRTCIDRRC